MLKATLAASAALALLGAGCASDGAAPGTPFEVSAEGEIALPHDDFYPEGVAVGADGDVYVGSIARGEIYRLSRATKTMSLFAGGGADLMSIIGVYATFDGEAVYACSSDPTQSHGGRASELVAFDADSGAVAGRYPLPGGGFCNDIYELSDGTIVVSDSGIGRVLRLRPGSEELQVLAQSPRWTGEGFNTNGLTTLNGDLYVVKYNEGLLFRVEPRTGDIDEVALDRKLQGPDGLESLDDGSLLVVEGTAGALSIITLEGGMGRVETIATGLDVPTTVAVYRNSAYVVQSQFDHLFGFDPTPPQQFALKRVALP